MKKLLSLFVGTEDPATSSESGSELKDLGPTPAGGDAWAEFEKLAARKSGKPLAEAIAGQPGPNLDEVSVRVGPPSATQPVNEFVLPKKKADGGWDFTPVYAASNLVPSTFTAEQALEIIRSMPGELPLEVRRKTVSASIGTLGKTLGVTPETIAADAALKIAAVQDFQSKVDGNFAEYEAKAAAAIKEWEKKISDMRSSIDAARARAVELKNACIAEVDNLDDVTEFFTLDIGASKYAPAPETQGKEEPTAV